jgi:cytochrome c
MDDQFNTTAGWVLGAGIAALGLTLVTGQFYKHHPVEKGGYPVEAAQEDAGGAAAAVVPIATLMQTADAVKGAEVFKKCASCHTITSGGANGVGPNLYAILGAKHGHSAGFAYSAGMLAKPGNWDFDSLNSWLTKPKAYVEGTKMSFAGLSKGEDRANLIAYLNTQGSNLPLPATPAAAPAADPAAKPAATAAK